MANTRVVLRDVRLAFSQNLFFPDLTPDKTTGKVSGKYSCKLLLEPNSANHKAIISAINAAGALKWNEKAGKILSGLKNEGRLCIKDGNDKEWDGFEGHMYVSASSKKLPLIIDRYADANGKGVRVTEESGRIYAGCYVTAIVNIYAIDKAGEIGKRVCADLCGVQFWRDGDAFGGSSTATDDEFGLEAAPEAGVDLLGSDDAPF